MRKNKNSYSLTIATCLFLGLVLGSPMGLQAQKKAKSTPATEDNAVAHWQKIYDRGVHYNDLAVATEAVYHLRELQPERTGLGDTLARLYLERTAYTQCLLVSLDILEKDPENLVVREYAALSRQSLGMVKEALAEYETLFKATDNSYHLYEIAGLQYALRRYGECEESLNRLLERKDLDGKTISLAAANTRRQDVPMAAAFHNLFGVLEMDQGHPNKAENHFVQALRIYPEFILAQNNLKVLQDKDK